VLVERLDLDGAVPGQVVDHEVDEVELVRGEVAFGLEVVERGCGSFQTGESAQEQAHPARLVVGAGDVVRGAEPGFEEDLFQFCEVGGGDLQVPADLLDSQVVLVAAQVGADLRLESRPVGAERDGLEAGEGQVAELILEVGVDDPTLWSSRSAEPARGSPERLVASRTFRRSCPCGRRFAW
jgi:hypothetical protein